MSGGHDLPCQISVETEQARTGSTPAENNSTSSGCCGNIDNVGYTNKVTATDFYQKRCNSSLIKLIEMHEHMLRKISKTVYISPALNYHRNKVRLIILLIVDDNHFVYCHN